MDCTDSSLVPMSDQVVAGFRIDNAGIARFEKSTSMSVSVKVGSLPAVIVMSSGSLKVVSRGAQVRATSTHNFSRECESLGCRSPNVVLVSRARRGHVRADEHIASSVDSANPAAQKTENGRVAGGSE